MFLAIKVNLYTKNQGLLIAVKQILNNSDFLYLNTKNVELESADLTEIFKGVSAELHFEDDGKRMNAVTALRGLEGMIHACKSPESKIKGFNFNHAENESCELTEIYEEA